MSSTTPTVVVVTPASKVETSHQVQVRAAIKAEALDQGWSVLPFIRTQTIAHTSGAAVGRTVAVLTPQDTETVYRQAHHGPFAVLATTGYRVRRDPRADPSTDRVLWEPADFLRYKAHVQVVRTPGDAPAVLTAALSALSALACDGMNDARALPMQVFSPGGHGFDLASIGGQQAFRKRHGGPRERSDAEGRTWKKGPNHGKETLRLGGTDLPTGFHWDVTVPRGSSTLTNGWQVWELVDRHAYVNIAPDAGVRNGHRCKRRWPG